MNVEMGVFLKYQHILSCICLTRRKYNFVVAFCHGRLEYILILEAVLWHVVKFISVTCNLVDDLQAFSCLVLAKHTVITIVTELLYFP